MDTANTLFLRLEGVLQAWGDTSKFVIRQTVEAPTKSGVLGLVCCALGLSRDRARERLPELNTLAMGVRVDRPGFRWWDYHTVGANIGVLTADGKGIKKTASTKEIETLVTRREYLADASFLVALQGSAALISDIAAAVKAPKWPVFLGRKSCPPSVPVFVRPREGEEWQNPGSYRDLRTALCAVPWSPRYTSNEMPQDRVFPAFLEWRAATPDDAAPDDAEVWYDVPVSFDPPVHQPRFVLRDRIDAREVKIGEPAQGYTPPPPRPRADYKNSEYRQRRKERFAKDGGLCIFCKMPGPRLTVQHVTYRRAGGGETIDDLRTLCGLCHDAVSMIEYGLGMGMDRINPEDPRWRDMIIRKRDEIIKYRSLAIRRPRLTAEEEEEEEM